MSTEGRTIAEERMVAQLAPSMIAKLAKARDKGRGGWEMPEECSITHLHDCLTEHVWKANLDMVDVANIAGMIWWRLQHVPGDREVLAAHVKAQQKSGAERLEWVDKAKVLNQAEADGHLFEVVQNHGQIAVRIDGRFVTHGVPTIRDAMELAEIARKKLQKVAQR